MVTIKRYIGRIKKPLRWRGGSHFARYVLAPAIVAVIVMSLVRAFWFGHYALPYAAPGSTLQSGDRIVVNLAAYGFSTPLPFIFGEHRIANADPERGDLVVFYSADTLATIHTGRVEALPGDTIRLETDNHAAVDAAQTLSDSLNVLGRMPSRGILPERTYLVDGEIVGHRALIGRVVLITYSVDNARPFLSSLRAGRFFVKP